MRHVAENATSLGRPKPSASEKLKRTAQEFFDEEILWVEMFEPNYPDIFTWGILGLIGLLLKRRAIKNGGRDCPRFS